MFYKKIRLVFFIILLCILSVQISNAQWAQVNNGMGNNVLVHSIVVNGNNIFAGANIYGVYLSTNNGASWTQTSLNNQWVRALAVNGNNIFAGTHVENNGVFLSTDNGITWAQTSLNNQWVYSFAVIGNNIFAGVLSNGLYRSTDNGASWAQTSLNNLNVLSLAVNGNYIFAGTGSPDNGAYLSTNNGTTWAQTSLNNRSVYSLAVIGNNIFAGTGANGVYLSTDNGANWTQTPLNNQTVLSLAVNGSNIFAGTDTSGVFVSNNNGTTWTQRNEGLGDFYIWTLRIFNNYIFAGTYGGGVYRRPLGELIGIQPISNEVPNQFSLSQNYPNPFNPKTIINFQLSINSFVNLKVYDVLGNEVETLVNEQLNAGTYQVDWNAAQFSSGVYYYKLVAHQGGSSTGDYVGTKKMLLVK